MPSKLKFTYELPRASRFGRSAILIYDRAIRSVKFKKWVQSFACSYGVGAGENLKDIRFLPAHLERLTRLTAHLSARDLTVVVAGGGSVGDFGGFVASIFKRGVRLVHVPTTWLAALDSAHGGKTAMNVAGAKNQVGTFYPADEIWLVKRILLEQSAERVADARGELAKTALLDRKLWLTLTSGPRRLKPITGKEMWHYLKTAIAVKTKVVAKDPLEKKGLRQILNLGHTFGHIIEAQTGLSHGQAVAQGLIFALQWSFERGELSLTDYGKIRHALSERFDIKAQVTVGARRKLRATRVKELLKKDKKRTDSGNVTFVFLQRVGRPVRKSIAVDDVLLQARSQGWV